MAGVEISETIANSQSNQVLGNVIVGNRIVKLSETNTHPKPPIKIISIL